jgi:DNA-directed RNA polymerase specialized sigma24 family protein
MSSRRNGTEEQELKLVSKKLDRLIRIMALSVTRGLTTTEKISMLHQAGFTPTEIAEILGTSRNVVNVRLSEMRRRRS